MCLRGVGKIISMFNHDPKDDPYDPNWRRTRGKITRVEINLETTGISPEGLIEIHSALERGEMFIVHNNKDSMIAFYPDKLKAWQKAMGVPDVWTTFDSFNEMVNNLKLCLFEHNQVVVPSKIIDGC